MVMHTAKNLVEDINATVENAVRLSTFMVARDSFMEAGLDRDEAVASAASMAKNMTINFNRKGESGNFLNGLYLFFNAQVQGTRVVLRGVAGSKVKRGILGGAVTMGAFMAMMHEWAEDEDA